MAAQLAISGLALGSIYALLGLGLVLIHKATDVVNFAQGEIAMFMTFVAFALLVRGGLPLWLVFLVAPLVGALLSGVTEHIVMRPIADGPPVNALIATIGLWIVFNNAAGWIWGFDPYRFPSLFPADTIEVLGVRISENSIGVIAVSFAIMIALYVFFEFTREGTAMRAASMNRRAAQLMGIRVSRVSFLAWAVAGAIGTVCGMLVAPTLFLDFEMMVTVLLKSFAGAILGGFNSLPGAVLGCLMLGMAETFFGGYVSTAFKDSFAFVVIVGVLMFRPTGLFSRAMVKKV
jgi:branched-chain amino acid transport system permease protein